MADYTKKIIGDEVTNPTTEITPVSYTQTTTETITENFKDLMAEIDARLLVQYTAGRIKGPDYSNVYLSAMQTALQLAAQVETFEAKRASHERQWKLKVVESLSSQHAMISNVLGTLDEANILPILRDTFNDLYGSAAPAYVATVTYLLTDRITYNTVQYICVNDDPTVSGTPGIVGIAPDHATYGTACWRKALLWD